ncbi:MAG TPA: T9SS type A sorting domain-containing protein [Puia sp.]|jgi:predicted esterase|nr:T9SS type A sorting domain-containing protein [Puia sp.]
MKEFYTFLRVSLFAFLTNVFAGTPAAAQTLTPRYISTCAHSLGFYEYLPAGYDPASSKKYPLIVFLHGIGELGNGTTQLPNILDNGIANLIGNGTFPKSFTVNGQTFSFIVIMPQFTNWPGAADASSVLDYAVAHYNVDLNRLYMTGLSMGGGTVWAYAGASIVNSQRLAAILPVSGAFDLDAQGGQNIATAELPVFATQNQDDPTVNVYTTINNIKFINSSTNPAPNPPALDTIFPVSGHDSWTTTYNPNIALHNGLNVYQWLLQFQRGTAGAVPLPVTMTAYAAVVSGSVVNVDWTTAIEQNNRYFIIQRSTDGQNFSNLDTIASAGPTQNGHSYIYTDAHPAAGDNFYRLEQVDLDGTATYFGVLKVSLSTGSGTSFHLTPNPASGPVYLEMANAVTGPLQVRLSDAQGRILRAWTFDKQSLDWTQAIDPGTIPAGSYFITVYGNSFKEVRQLIRK